MISEITTVFLLEQKVTRKLVKPKKIKRNITLFGFIVNPIGLRVLTAEFFFTIDNEIKKKTVKVYRLKPMPKLHSEIPKR